MHYLSRDSDQPPNLDYEKDIVYVTKHNKWVLNCIGIWPATVLNGIGQFMPKIMNALCNVTLILTVIPSILYIKYEKKDTLAKLKLCALLTFCLFATMKHWALTIRKSTIRLCIEQVKADWRQVKHYKERVMMLKYGRMCRKLTLLCAVFMYSGGIIYHTIMQYAIGAFIDGNNQTVRPLVYPTYSALYDVQVTPIYEMVFIFHCINGYVICSIAAGTCGLAALFVTHACGQIDIVVSRLNDLLRKNSARKNVDTQFTEIVQHHLRILRFSTTMVTILQEICFVETVGSTCLICLCEYFVIADWEQSNTVSFTTHVILLMSLSFNIFILCYIGELIMEKSGSIGLSCFMMDWYNLPTKTMRDIVLIMAMSNNPTKITAGRVVNLSISTFGSILKTSLAYLSFLRTAVL